MNCRERHAIYQSNNIRDILKYCTYNTWILFDLDNTVCEPIQDLGSDQWFTSFFEYAATVTLDKAEAFSLVITVYDAVQQHVSHRAVEPGIVRLIYLLQEAGVPVLGLTARSNRITERTLQQLGEIGIDFSRYWGKAHIDLSVEGKQTPVFHNGIIFCDGLDKGKCFKSFSDYIDFFPPAVVMADDKEKHLHAVNKVVENAGGSFVGLRYGYLDEKAAGLDLSRATVELTNISHLLPEGAREAIAKLKVSSSVLVSNSLFSHTETVSDQDCAPSSLYFSSRQ